MAKENIITVLDIGASKVSCLIGQALKGNLVDVLGYGVCHHSCLRHGIVADIKGLSEVISRAIYGAEEISGKKAESAFFNISGTHIKGVASHGEVVIPDRDNEITRRDVERVMANAKSIHMPYERDIIYTVKKGFSVDGEKGIVDPAGMFGLKLETDIYLVTAKISVIDNLKKAIRQAGITADDYIISGLATASGVLSPHDKELGAILIDIGADLTEVLIFLDGGLAHISVLPSGGDNITKAISDRLRIPEGQAERVKIENGTLEETAADEKITVTVDSHKKTISKAELKKILRLEYEKIFNAIKKELLNTGFWQDATSGVVVCGQPAMMDSCLETAEFILNFPVRMGHILNLGSSPKPLPSHIYATSVGLLRYAQEARRCKKPLLHMGAKNIFTAVTDRARSLYNDYF